MALAAFEDVIDRVCKHLPRGYELMLFMENGAAWIEMYKDAKAIDLEDPTDKTLYEQLNDALCIANGF